MTPGLKLDYWEGAPEQCEDDKWDEYIGEKLKILFSCESTKNDFSIKTQRRKLRDTSIARVTGCVPSWRI